MTNDTKSWPSPQKAVLIIVQLLPEGKHLAGFMTDEWFFYGCQRRSGKHYPANLEQPHMAEIYGSNWRETHPNVFAAYREAYKWLAKLLNQGKIDGKGRYKTEDGRREITRYEWSTGYLDIEKGELSHKQGETAADFRAIVSIILNPDSVLHEAVRDAAASAPKAKAKSVNDCGKWLAQKRCDTQTQPPIRDILEAEAEEKFNVGTSQFRKAWDWAAQEVPNDLWSQPGARKGNTNAAKPRAKTIVSKTIVSSKQS
jgi:hypothetical protein